MGIYTHCLRKKKLCTKCNFNTAKERGAPSYHGLCTRCFKIIGNKYIVRRKEGSGIEKLRWKKLRYQILVILEAKCMCCRATNSEIHVDHIAPKIDYPKLRYNPINLQILCKDCNQGKLDLDMTDWRKEQDIISLLKGFGLPDSEYRKWKKTVYTKKEKPILRKRKDIER